MTRPILPPSTNLPAPSRRKVLRFAAAGVLAISMRDGKRSVALADDRPLASSKGIYVESALLTGEQVENASRGLFLIDPESGSWSKLADDLMSVRVSPDGTKAAYVEYGEPVNAMMKAKATWVADLVADQKPCKVADVGGSTSWSPDGKSLILVQGSIDEVEDKLRHKTFRVNVDGTNLREIPIPETDQVDDWSPDGRWVVTVSDRHPPHGRGYQLYLMKPDGSEQRRLTNNVGLNVHPRFSGDGLRILYHHQKGKDSMWSTDLEGKDHQLILDEKDLTAPEMAAWSPDGKHLAVTMITWKRGANGRKYYDNPSDSNPRIVILDSDGKNLRVLPLPKSLYFGSIAWL